MNSKLLLIPLTVVALLSGCGSDYSGPQQTFVSWHKSAVKGYSDASNELQYTEIWERREKGLCEKLPDGNITDWVGVVERVGKNLLDTQESANIDVRIYEGKSYLLFSTSAINVKTLVGSVADSAAAIRLGFNPQTTIIKGTLLYDQLMMLSEGDKVRISGRLIKDSMQGACFYEMSLSMNGKIRWPEYVVKFSKIEKL